MSAPLWMPLAVSDYLRDTRHLSTLESGAYLHLLMAAWTGEGPLPADEKRLARIAGMSAAEWEESREVLLAFFTFADGAYRNKRLDQELVKAGILIEQKRAAGKASAAAKAAAKAAREAAERAAREGNERSNSRSTGVATGGQREGNQSQSQGSVSKETGGKPPPGLGKEVFDNGVALLVRKGEDPKSARSLVAKWRKSANDTKLSGLIRQAKEQDIADPLKWITASINRAANDTASLYASIERTFGGVTPPASTNSAPVR